MNEEHLLRKFTFTVEDHLEDRITVSMTVEPPAKAEDAVTPASVFAAEIIKRVQELAAEYGKRVDPERN